MDDSQHVGRELPPELLGAWPRPARSDPDELRALVRCRKCRVIVYRRDRTAHLSTCRAARIDQLFEELG